MKASLWDGVKQIQGDLILTEDSLEFTLSDFKDTSLELFILRKDIIHIRRHRIFGIADQAIEVLIRNGKKNVFVVDDEDGNKLLL